MVWGRLDKTDQKLSKYRPFLGHFFSNKLLFAEEKKDILSQSMLNFDYQKMIQWSIEYGLVMPQIKEFLLPFKDWLLSKNIEYNQYEPNKPKQL